MVREGIEIYRRRCIALLEEALAAIATGCGQPALYHYELYRSSMAACFPEIPEEDRERMAFGGCTELMREGISAVGSVDHGINIALIFSDWLRKGLAESVDFEAFKAGFVQEMRERIAHDLDILNEHRRTRALYCAQPVRTLFVDDCIDRQQELYQDGPRWIWSLINIAGVVNMIDSMNVVRELVYEKQLYGERNFWRSWTQGIRNFCGWLGNVPVTV